MTAHKAIFGLSAVCAMTICAVVAQGAGAVSQTGYTCKPVIGGAQFSDEHCTKGGALASRRQKAIRRTRPQQAESNRRS
jgi:hypothetical protein